MARFAFEIEVETRVRLGLIALQADRSIEDDFRRLMPADVSLLVSRVPSGQDVTADSLAAMEQALATAAGMFPVDHGFDVIGYGCTSGTAQIGAARVAREVRRGAAATAVTEPVSALVAACRALGLRRLAILSPYVADVSDRLRTVLRTEAVETPVFGSFEESHEATVAMIRAGSIRSAARALMQDAAVDGLFLSCTNLRTLDVIAPLSAAFDRPVLSSNLVLAWDMLRRAGRAPATPGALL